MAFVSFASSYVMKESGNLRDEWVYPLSASEDEGELPYELYVSPEVWPLRTLLAVGPGELFHLT
jgi:hypothetical protein